MNLAAECARLLPYRVRPDVYDVDTRDGLALMNLYAYHPDAHGSPCGVKTWASRKPQVILSDRSRVEWSPKDAVAAMLKGAEPNRSVLEAIAIRFTAREVIRRAKAGHSQAADRFALVALRAPQFDELVARWLETLPNAPDFIETESGGLRIRNGHTIEPFIESERVRVDVVVLRGSWRPANEVIVRRRLDCSRRS
jgi:hypothetical protein